MIGRVRRQKRSVALSLGCVVQDRTSSRSHTHSSSLGGVFACRDHAAVALASAPPKAHLGPNPDDSVAERLDVLHHMPIPLFLVIAVQHIQDTRKRQYQDEWWVAYPGGCHISQVFNH
jgi:hypothetical protein